MLGWRSAPQAPPVRAFSRDGGYRSAASVQQQQQQLLLLLRAAAPCCRWSSASFVRGVYPMAEASAELKAWVAAQKDFELFAAPNGKTKVKCVLTDHELLPSLEMCTAYLSGKAYKKAKRKQELDAFDFSQFEPHIVAHETDPHLLLCVRTQKTLMRDVTAVQNYVNTRSYQVAIEHWKSGKVRGGVEISKLEQGAERKKSAAADEEDDDVDDDEDEEEDDITAAEFAEMEQLAVRRVPTRTSHVVARLSSCFSLRWLVRCSSVQLTRGRGARMRKLGTMRRMAMRAN